MQHEHDQTPNISYYGPMLTALLITEWAVAKHICMYVQLYSGVKSQKVKDERIVSQETLSQRVKSQRRLKSRG